MIRVKKNGIQWKWWKEKREQVVMVFTKKDHAKIPTPQPSSSANSKSKSKYTGYFRYSWKITYTSITKLDGTHSR